LSERTITAARHRVQLRGWLIITEEIFQYVYPFRLTRSGFAEQTASSISRLPTCLTRQVPVGDNAPTDTRSGDVKFLSRKDRAAFSSNVEYF
jgi:hypothetical protein